MATFTPMECAKAIEQALAQQSRGDLAAVEGKDNGATERCRDGKVAGDAGDDAMVAGVQRFLEAAAADVEDPKPRVAELCVEFAERHVGLSRGALHNTQRPDQR